MPVAFAMLEACLAVPWMSNGSALMNVSTMAGMLWAATALAFVPSRCWPCRASSQNLGVHVGRCWRGQLSHQGDGRFQDDLNPPPAPRSCRSVVRGCTPAQEVWVIVTMSSEPSCCRLCLCGLRRLVVPHERSRLGRWRVGLGRELRDAVLPLGLPFRGPSYLDAAVRPILRVVCIVVLVMSHAVVLMFLRLQLLHKVREDIRVRLVALPEPVL